jgi:hypothetical protein
MTEQPDRPPKLDYVSPATSRPEISTQQVVGGCLLSVLAIGVTVPAVLVGGYAYAPRAQSAGAVAWLLIGAVIAGIGVIAWSMHRSPRWRGLGQGLWIGLGVAILLEGLCFLTLMR